MSPGRNGDLVGLPPATVITGELDPLVSEVSDYVERMLNAGNVVSSIEFKGQVHPFVQMDGIISDALIARTIIGSELKRALRGRGARSNRNLGVNTQHNTQHSTQHCTC